MTLGNAKAIDLFVERAAHCERAGERHSRMRQCWLADSQVEDILTHRVRVCMPERQRNSSEVVLKVRPLKSGLGSKSFRSQTARLAAFLRTDQPRVRSSNVGQS
jgi:hypothetical protein